MKNTINLFKGAAVFMVLSLCLNIAGPSVAKADLFGSDSSTNANQNNTIVVSTFASSSSTNSNQDNPGTFGSDSSTNSNQDNPGTFGSDSSTNPNQDGSGLFGSDSSTNQNQDNSGPDTVAPVIASVANISTTTTDNTVTSIVVTYTSPTAIDAHDGSITPVCTPASGSSFPVGTNVVTCTATDAAGNTATTTFNIVVTAGPAPIVPTIISSGGSSSGGYSSGGGGGGYATVAPLFATTTATTTSTLANALSCPFLTNYVIPGRANLTADIAKVQLFLNLYNSANLPINGILNQATVNAVEAFQSAHLSDVMGPWGLKTATGEVYITTLKEINAIVCGSTKALTAEELAVINAYKAGLNQPAPTPAPTVTTPTITLPGTTPAPEILGQVTPSPSTSTTSAQQNPGIINNNTSLAGNAISAVGGFFGSIFSKIGSWFK